MAKGEKQWTGGGEVVKRTFAPVPNKEWEGKLVADAAEIKKKQEEGSVYRVDNIRFVCFDSAEREGGKDRMIFHRLFLSLKPAKDGTVMPEWANGLRGLMKALGDVRNFPTKVLLDEDGNPTDVAYIDPKAVLEYLKEHNGETLRFKSKIEKGSNGYDDKAIVDYFIEKDESEFGEEEDEAEEAEDDEEAEDADEAEEAEEADEDEDEDEDEEEEKPAPKKKSKVVQGPTGKKKKK